MKKAVLIFALWSSVLSVVQATTFTVSNTNDSGAGSLRQAILSANADASATAMSPHQINFTLPNGSTITVLSPFLVITNHVSINGLGVANLIISGGSTSRIFWIQNGTIIIQNLTLANGYAKGGDGGGGGMGAGGAIFMHEGKEGGTGSINLSLINVNLNNNTARGGNSISDHGGGGMGGNGQAITGIGVNTMGGGAGGVLGNGDDTGGSITDANGVSPGTNGGIPVFGGGGSQGIGNIAGFGGGAGRGVDNIAGFGGGAGTGIDNIAGFGGGAGSGIGNPAGFGGGSADGVDNPAGFGGGAGNGNNGGGGMGAGGAIFVASGSLNLTGVTFSNNNATRGNNGAKGYGGALFVFNKADNGGNVAPGTTNDPSVTMCNVTFSGNTADDDNSTYTNNDNVYASNPSSLDPTGYISSNATTICAGESIQLSFTLDSDAGPFDIVVNGTTYNDVPSGSMFLTLTEGTHFTGTTNFNLTQITDANDCVISGLAQIITINVNTVNAGSVSADQTVCFGGDPDNFISTNDGSGAGTVTYRWESSTTNCDGGFNPIMGATGATYDPPTGLSQTTYYRRVTISNLNGVFCEAIGNCVTVTVDIEKPTITCPTNLTVNNDLDQCSAVVTYTAPVGTDNCPGATTTQTAGLASGAAFPVGITTNTFVVTASNGQKDTCSFTVTVVDNQAPTASCQAPFTITLNSTGQYALTVAEVNNGSSDNCGIVAYTLSKTNFTCADIGKKRVTLKVTDAAGLSDSCTVEVTVQGSASCVVSISNAGGPTIADPCQCSTVPLYFDEEIVITGNSNEEAWVLASNTGLIDPNTGLPYPANTPFVSLGNNQYSLVSRHKSGEGYSITATSSFYPDTILTIGNTCYYPHVAINGLPALVSPNAAPFVVTGVETNNAVGTGTFALNGNTQPGAGPSPTALTINPGTLPLGTNTLTYQFDAGAAASGDSLDPGCINTVTRSFRVANCGCQDVTVSLDANCQFVLTGNLVSDVNCGGGTVRVMDNDPSNGNLIDCAGVWTYGLFDAFGNIICWGKVTAEDKTAPALVCAPADFTLDCYDVNYVLNNHLTIGNVGATSSPRPVPTSKQTIANAEGVAGTGDNCQLGLVPPGLVADNIWNLGYAYFRDNCYTCGCRITLKWSDKVEFYSCEQMRTNGGIYAKISREWVATDCNGMRSSYVQSIYFTRPAVDDFVFNGPGEGKYDRVVEYNSCTPDKSLIKKEDVTPYVCSYFNTSGNPRCFLIDQVECNYSVQIKDTEFPICGGKGIKIDRELYVFDWCAGGIVDTFHILIKIGDFQTPTVEYAHGAPYDISTGPMDCTAAIPVTVAGIKSQFGVTIKDNCTLGNVSVSVYTKDRYVKGILVYEGAASPFCPNVREDGAELRGDHDSYRLGACNKDNICWDKVDYAVMNGMMIGLPVGRHLMVIDAFDGCYNTSTTCFLFDVKDKIAPVMKCDDDLHVTLSNANGYTSGYAQVSADDIDEGSWDNCKLAWIAVRRNVPDACAASFIAKGYDTNGNGKLDALPADNDYSKADGFDLNGDGDISDFGETFILKGGKLMTPLADFVEFFCCDLTERVTVELWGGDIYGNTNYCWMDLLIEDKVAPTCIAPWDVTIYCDDKNIAQIDDKIASAKIFGDVTIPTGNDCAALDTVYSTVKSLKCGAGYIDRIWTMTKQTAKGPISITCKQRINILPVHEYNICFPKDVPTDCKTPIIDTVVTDELACDILAVNVSDKRYDASDDECYKIFRTYTVINWCVYDDRCGDPMAEGNVYVVDRATFGNYGKAPLYVLVRDRQDNVRDGIEEFYLSKDLTAGNADDIRFTPPICTPVEPKFNENNLIPVEGEYYHSFMYTQIIKVYDDTRPVVEGLRDTFCTDPAACVAKITKVIKITDNCTDQVELETQFLMIAPFQTTDAGKMILYSTPRWSIVNVGGGIYNISVTNLPEGTHDLIVVGRDECGNLSLPTRIPFVVKDCKAPAPICINGLSTDLMPDGNGGGMMTVWATDFVASKIYDCNGQGPETKDGLKLVTKYSVNRVGKPVDQNQTSINMTCADLELGFILVELHAWDNAGNHDFCITFVEVQDNNKVCPGSASPAVIAGTVATEGHANLQGVSVTLSGSASKSATTSTNGGYSFINLTKGGDYTVTPQLDKNYLNGVSTFDLVLIQKHILGVQALNSPYKMIAADVNNSKSISTLDLIQLRKLILNIDSQFANNTSWRFVDAAYNFPNQTNPWSASFPEVVNINDFSGNRTANFVAIKVGDVNAGASVNGAANAEIRTSTNFEIKAQEQSLKAGNEYKIAFEAKDLQNIQGYQFALNLDQSKVELLDIHYGVAKAENFGIFKDQGLITTSWNAKYEPGTLFTLVIRAKADGKLSQSLSLNRLLHPEAYDQNDEYLGIKLGLEGEQISDSCELKQNVPNPFNAETNIGFTLPKAAKATLTIRDVKGALIYKVEGNYAKGNNQVTLKKTQLGASGVLYYTLETNDFTATKKMIVLQ